MEGRDITTVVLPNATVKFYVTATLEERAKRRFLQYAGKEGAPTYDEVLSDLKKRDESDSNRTYGRLEIAPDAIVIDTTSQSISQMTDKCLKLVRKNLQKAR